MRFSSARSLSSKLSFDVSKCTASAASRSGAMSPVHVLIVALVDLAQYLFIRFGRTAFGELETAAARALLGRSRQVNFEVSIRQNDRADVAPRP